MSGGDGRRIAKRARHDQQPQPHHQHQQPPSHSLPTQQPMHPGYYPSPPPGAGMYPWMLPPGPHGMSVMPAAGYTAAAPPAQAQTPSRTAAARRRVSPTTDADNNSINTGTRRTATTNSNNTPAPPLHLRVAYRTQTHTCATCPISSPSSTYVTHPGPQHYPTCPRHRRANSTSTSTSTSSTSASTAAGGQTGTGAAGAGGRINNLANHQTRCSYAKVQSALTREYRTTQKRIEEHIQKQRGEVLAELERSRRKQLQEALQLRLLP